MMCALTAVMFGMYPLGIMYKVCEYRCPAEKSRYYHYFPRGLRIAPDLLCPPYLKVRRLK